MSTLITLKRSIAWAIASPLAEAGARLAFSYQSERLRPGLEKLTGELRDPVLVECDVQKDEQLDSLFTVIEEELGHLDFVVHSLAYSPQETFSEETREFRSLMPLHTAFARFL